jgi:carboxynorspermidine decarboxylase
MLKNSMMKSNYKQIMDLPQLPSPCFVIDQEALAKNMARLNKLQDRSGAKVLVSLKAFCDRRILNMIEGFDLGVSASSAYEARMALAFTSGTISTYSPVYSEDTVGKIATHSSKLIFNSLRQYHRLRNTVRQSSSLVSLGLRVNPEFSIVNNMKYDPSFKGSRLGIKWKDLMIPPDVEGLHFHSAFESEFEDFALLVEHIEERFGDQLKQVKWVNLGGGQIIDSSLHVMKYSTLLKKFSEKWGVQVYIEPGSAAFKDAGVLVATVEDVVESQDFDTAILNCSFAAHMPDVLEAPYDPPLIGHKVTESTRSYAYRFGGNSCLAGDHTGTYLVEDTINVGDKIMFGDMVQYSMVKLNYFNGLAKPSIALWSETKGFKIIRKFDYNDYKNQM